MEKKTFLITGANGFLGGKLTKCLVDVWGCNVFALASSKEKIAEMSAHLEIKNREQIIATSNEEFFSDDFCDIKIDAAIHLASSRANRPNKEIANSIDFARKVFEKCFALGIQKMANVSSISVYAQTEDVRTENTEIAPNGNYPMSKYAIEVLLESIYSKKANANWTNLRLCSVIQSQKLVQALSKNAKQEGSLNIKGGGQIFQYIDADDAVNAFATLLLYDKPWERAYNIGNNNAQISLIEMANRIATLAKVKSGRAVKINIEKCDDKINSQMDASKFMNATGWSAKISIEEMIEKIFDES